MSMLGNDIYKINGTYNMLAMMSTIVNESDSYHYGCVSMLHHTCSDVPSMLLQHQPLPQQIMHC